MSVQTVNKVTPLTSQSKGYSPFVKVHEFTHASLNASNEVAFPVEKDTLVLGVWLVVTTAFNNSVDCEVGDPADPDGYIPAVSVNPTTVGAVGSLGLSGAAYSAGKYYTANSRIAVKFTAAPTAGKARLVVLTAGVDQWENVPL